MEITKDDKELEIEKLQSEIERLKKELKKRKKYGLVWEEKPEEVVEMCKKKLPVLKEVRDKEIITDKEKPVNLLIEGDNYHALSVLNYTHQGKIDVIYIDPPYNTGNKSWKYNNQYIEKDDAFRHSKWISFMSKRLKIAKNLLKNEGIMMVAIDDYECHTLRLLVDEIYGEENRLGTIVVVHNPGGRSDDKFIATSHEYLLVYGKNKEFSKINFLPLSPEQIEEYKYQDDISRYKLQSFMRTGSNSRPEDRPKLYYPIYYNQKDKTLSLNKEGENFIKVLPISSDEQKRVWRWGSETFDKNKDTEFVVNTSRGKITIQVKKRFQGNGDDGSKPKTFWQDPKYNASTHGTILLQNILRKEKPFNYPKSLYAVLDALVISTNKNSIILDYFAGSGTTGHAVMELNKRDNGNRKFILCTNNEGGICEDVCYPRINNVINGYKNKKNKLIAGLGGNLKYFKTDFVDYDEPTDKNKIKLTEQATEMLCIKEGTFETVINNERFKVFKSLDHYTGIIWDQLSITEFKNSIKEIEGKFSVYIFSLTDETFDEEFQDIKQKIELSPIPESILRVYRRIFK
jgi:adenine-specific DNA-methyltransferase